MTEIVAEYLNQRQNGWMRREIIALEARKTKAGAPEELDKWFVECIHRFMDASRFPMQTSGDTIGLDETVRRTLMTVAASIEPGSAEKRTQLYWNLLLTIRQHCKRHMKTEVA